MITFNSRDSVLTFERKKLFPFVIFSTERSWKKNTIFYRLLVLFILRLLQLCPPDPVFSVTSCHSPSWWVFVLDFLGDQNFCLKLLYFWNAKKFLFFSLKLLTTTLVLIFLGCSMSRKIPSAVFCAPSHQMKKISKKMPSGFCRWSNFKVQHFQLLNSTFPS